MEIRGAPSAPGSLRRGAGNISHMKAVKFEMEINLGACKKLSAGQGSL